MLEIHSVILVSTKIIKKQMYLLTFDCDNDYQYLQIHVHVGVV